MANQLKEPTTVIIPVDTAIRRTTNWRNFCTEALQITDPKKLPKAVYISKADIQALAAQCSLDDSIAGVRAYFTLNNAVEEKLEATVKNEIRFVMVLVKLSDKLPFGEDILRKPKVLSDDNIGEGDDEGDSNVFDFTRPCPDCCDPESELFGQGG